MIENKKASDLEYHLGFWLRFVSNHVSFSFRDRIAKYDITVAEWVVLRSLFNRTRCTLSTLSKHIGIDLGATSRLIERLLKKKLVTRKISTADRRFVELELSPAGRKLIPKLAHEADINDEIFFNPLSREDKNHLLRIMKTLVKLHNLTEKPTE
ncbi:MAG: MarR family transcriptional regulator [Bdellovibrionaceae bacterium]|nr:MarR family transcriptional regulator [Pseudobdellovibrionaceae bacterium]